jgi:hypothetical protein
MNGRALAFVFLGLIGCGGRVDAPTVDDGGPGDGSSTSDGGSAGGGGGSGPTLPVDDGIVWQSYGVPFCSGAIVRGDACRPRAEWWAQAATACAGAGTTLLYFELGDLCPLGAREVKYTCCPASTPREKLDFPSSDTCPPLAESWAPGTACVEPLWCNYPNACGDLDNWHCKFGAWAMNTWTYCAKK